MSASSLPTVRQWLSEPLSPEVGAVLERLQRIDDAVHIAVMPDVHLAADVCNGTVLATARSVYPNAVGGDIGCGMAAVGFDCAADMLGDRIRAGRLMAELYNAIPFNRHRTRVSLPADLAAAPLSHPSLEKIRSRDGLVQFGTLGRGNHFVEFQADDEQRLWVMVHSGSRAIGQAIRDFHLLRATASSCGLKGIDAESLEGMAYLNDATWAVRYAEESRLAMIAAATRTIRALFNASDVPDSLISTVHNHVQREVHLGQALWVHRKGAMPAFDGQAGVIPGSMGTESYHVVGRGCPDSLCSCSHGAGRAMSRHDASWKISAVNLCKQMEGIWFDVRHAARLREEAPGAYRDIREVMRAQKDLVRIVRRLRPVLSYKGT